jgi:hypothetical protein
MMSANVFETCWNVVWTWMRSLRRRVSSATSMLADRFSG